MSIISSANSVARLPQRSSIASTHHQATKAEAAKQPKARIEAHNEAERRANATSYQTRKSVQPPSAAENAQRKPEVAWKKRFHVDTSKHDSVELKA